MVKHQHQRIQVVKQFGDLVCVVSQNQSVRIFNNIERTVAKQAFKMIGQMAVKL